MTPKEPKDLPRDELFDLAADTLRRHPDVQLYFKFTCSACGQRCTLEDANSLPKSGECFKCGKDTEIKEGGFMLVFTMEGRKKDAEVKVEVKKD